MAKQSALWTIDAGQPYADALAHGILRRFGENPLTLSDCLILLPNRRAVRTLQTAFLQVLDAKATVLPQMAVLGDDPEQGLEDTQLGAALTPTMDKLERLKLLARLIDAWQADLDPKPAATPAHVARLAASLARFVDQSQTEGLDFAALDELVPEEFAVHWQKILTFLKIVTSSWPAILAETGRVDESLARRERLEALVARWAAAPPNTPVIAAGSTGSIPATADLLSVIAQMPQGHVVLPPLDQDVDEDTWQAIDEGHPQGALKRLLARLDTHRADVRPWHDAATSPAITHRLNALRAAMSPAETFHKSIAALPDTPLDDGIALIEADSGQEEATAMALILRHALETPEQTAALITPDRILARQVASVLSRWDIRIDDSAGLALAHTPPARFVFLLAEALASGLAPAPLLALLKHPFFTFHIARAEVLRIARHLDKTLLRGVRRAGGLSALTARLEDGEASAFLERLEGLFARWPTQGQSAERLITALLEIASELTDGPDGPGLFAGEDGNALALWADRACQPGQGFQAVEPAMIGPLMEAMMGGEVVRPGQPAHPRLAILGTIEARMVRPDVAVLGGLNDGTWPPAATADPWMNEPMRVAYGLPPHDRRIGLSALDFFQACGAQKVYLCRTTKKDGAPTLPSRWVSRLTAAFGGTLSRGSEVLEWAKALDAPEAYRPWPQPKPTPPLALRPRDLSVSDIERWLRDPYALYAKHVLKLKPLDTLDQPPGAADKGSTIHAALEAFFAGNKAGLPADAYGALMAAGESVFDQWRSQPGIYALWWPRFADLAAWIIKEQTALLSQGRTIAGVEISGRLSLKVGQNDWTIRAKADRIDRQGDGLTILDYKTGAVPQRKQVVQGYAPQLTIEGLMAQQGAFDLPSKTVEGLEYWGLSTTGSSPPERNGRFDAPSLIDQARAGLDALFSAFGDAKTPYLHAPAPEYAPYRDYDDLARPEEWRDVPEAQSGAGGGP